MLRVVSYAAVFAALVLVTLVAVQAASNYRRRFIADRREGGGALPGRFPGTVMAAVPARCGRRRALMAVVSGFKPVMVLLGAISGFLVPRFYLGAMEQRRRAKFDAELIDAVTMVAGAMKVGMSLLQAMEQVTREMGPPIRQEFAHALQENRVGKPIIQALQDMKNRLHSEDLRITVDAIGIAQETGGVLSDVLLKIAETIRGGTESGPRSAP